jgi:hypothetical protein
MGGLEFEVPKVAGLRRRWRTAGGGDGEEYYVGGFASDESVSMQVRVSSLPHKFLTQTTPPLCSALQNGPTRPVLRS